jgi:hypothetical protein
MITRPLAALGPAAVVLAALAAGGFFAGDTPTAPTPTRQTQLLLAPLAADPDVLVLGNSQAASGVDAAALAAGLGLDPPEVARLTPPGSHAPLVWALLKHRVYDAGLRPRVVLLAMSADHLLDDDPPDGENRARLDQHVLGPDPVLANKVLGTTWPRWDAAVGHARAARDGALQWLTAAPLGLIGEADPAARLAAARKAVLGEVAGAQLALNARMIPVVEERETTDASARDLDEALLVDILDLVVAHGGRPIVVTMPQRVRGLSVSRDLTARLTALTAAHGGAWVDLDHVPIPSDGWLDRGHLSPPGAAAFTAALVEALGDVGALADSPLRQLPPPLPPAKVTRTGDPPAPTITKVFPGGEPCRVRLGHDLPRALTNTYLSERGLGLASPLTVAISGQLLEPHRAVRPGQACEGTFAVLTDSLNLSPLAPNLDPTTLTLGWAPAPHPVRPLGSQVVEAEGWWIPRDGSLSWTWDTPIDLPPDSRLHLLIVPLEGVGEVRATWPRGGVTLEAWEGLRWATAPLPAGPLSKLRLEADAHAMVRAMVLERDGHPTWIAGRPDAPLHRLELEPGERVAAPGAPHAPRRVAAAVAPLGRELRWEIAGPDGALALSALVQAGGDPRFKKCIPFEARATDPQPELKEEVRLDTVGQATLPVPADTIGQWELWTRADPVCSRHLWLQPGERAELAIQTTALHVRVDRITLQATSFGGEGQIEVLGLGDPLVTFAVPANGIRRDTLLLPTPISPGEPLALRVQAPADGWLLLAPGELTPSAPPAAWFTVDEARAPATPLPPAPPAAAGPTHPTRVDLHADTTRIVAVPPGVAAASPVPGDGGPGVRLVTDERGQLCLPDLAASPLLRATARVRFDGGEGTVVMEARWLQGRRPTKKPDGSTDLDVARAANVGAAWTDLSLDSFARDGADGVRVCLRRQGVGTLEVGAWTAGPP